MTVHPYDTTFFDYIEHGARRSARVIVQRLRDIVDVDSVLDVGCGRGIWLAEWMARKVTDVIGLDGDYVSTDSLTFPRERFQAVDVTRPIDLGRKFSLVQSLEVGEHLPAAAARTFVATLTRHADLVLFSAARPGQGGEHHVNEQPYDYWRELFHQEGYGMYDVIRPWIFNSVAEPWYRYNTFLFASERGETRLPQTLRQQRLDDNVAVPDIAPLWWRARCLGLRCVPFSLVNRLALVKHSTIVGWRSVARRT